MAKKKEEAVEPEVLPDVIGTEQYTTTLVIPDEIEINGLKVSDSLIEAKVAEVMMMTINGVEDKEGYKAALEERAKLVKFRTGTEGWRKGVVKPVQDFMGKLKVRIDGFGTRAKKGEDHLNSIIKPIEEELERIKEEKANEKLRVFQARITELQGMGAAFDGQSTYSFAYDNTLNVTSAVLQKLTDDEYDYYLVEAKASYAIEQQRLAEVEAEDKRQKEEVITLAAKNKLETASLNEKRTKLRKKEIALTGYLGDTPEYFILTASDDDWDNYILDVEAAMAITDTVVYEAGDLVENVPADPDPAPVDVEKEDEEELPWVEQSIAEATSVLQGDPIELPRFASSTLEFSSSNPYKDINVSPKFIIRLYPREFEELVIALDGHDNIAANGEVDSESNLIFMLVRK